MNGVKRVLAIVLLAGMASLSAPRALAGPEELPGITSPTSSSTTTTTGPEELPGSTGPEELPGLTETIVIVATSIIY